MGRAFKVGHYALSEPIPWTAKECRRAATVHLGGTFEEIVESSESEFERLILPAGAAFLFDATRALEGGQHTAWVYCHVPNGSGADC